MHIKDCFIIIFRTCYTYAVVSCWFITNNGIYRNWFKYMILSSSLIFFEKPQQVYIVVILRMYILVPWLSVYRWQVLHKKAEKPAPVSHGVKSFGITCRRTCNAARSCGKCEWLVSTSLEPCSKRVIRINFYLSVCLLYWWTTWASLCRPAIQNSILAGFGADYVSIGGKLVFCCE